MNKKVGFFYALIFTAVCLGALGFLNLFMSSDDSLTYVNWDNAVRVEEDGTTTEIDPFSSTSSPVVGGTYRFTGSLPERTQDGTLVFETSGLGIELSINGKLVYSSTVDAPDDHSSGMSQAELALPAEVTGTMEVTCTVLGGSNTLFPPIVRFFSANAETASVIAYANTYAIPAGIAFLATVLVVGALLLSSLLGRPEWSLVPLSVALVCILALPITRSLGAYFLPEEVYAAIPFDALNWVAPVAFVCHFAMAGRRKLLRRLLVVAAWSAVAVIAHFAISYAMGGTFAIYVRSVISSPASYAEGLLLELTLWLGIVAGFLSAYEAAGAFFHQRLESRELRAHNQLVMKSYRAIESRANEDARHRHEVRHLLTALDALCEKNDLAGARALLGETLRSVRGGVTRFSDNFAMNAILQDASARASQIDVDFEASAQVPEDLPISEADLCVLLMNMIDNALEACERMGDERDGAGRRFVRFKAERRGDYLAIRCENTYSGKLRRTSSGKLASIKEDESRHGIGMRQMEEVAKRYDSPLDVTQTDESTFVVRLALRIPPPAAAISE